MLSSYAIVAMLIAAMMGGCTPSGEVVSVTERPDSTEGAVGAETELPTLPLTAFPAGYDTVRVRPFDLGKMWSIDRVPTSYFQNEYEVAASDEWREHAQYAAVRFNDTCSGGFVSNTGLVVTNHHCAREHITAVEEEG